MSAPKRLLEDPTTVADLRADLQAAAHHQVTYDLSAGLTRFEAALSSGVASGGSSMAGLKSTLIKLGAVGVVAGAVVAGLLYSDGGSNEPSAVSAPQRAKPKVTPPPASRAPQPNDPEPVDQAAPVAEAAVTPSSEPSSQTAVRRQARPNHGKPSASAEPTRDELLAREVAELRKIRSTLGSDPTRALAMANAGHVEFRHGVLYQEREALALRALQALGRRSELEARGERYLQAFPHGSFSGQVRQMLGRAEGP